MFHLYKHRTEENRKIIVFAGVQTKTHLCLVKGLKERVCKTAAAEPPVFVGRPRPEME